MFVTITPTIIPCVYLVCTRLSAEPTISRTGPWIFVSSLSSSLSRPTEMGKQARSLNMNSIWSCCFSCSSSCCCWAFSQPCENSKSSHSSEHSKTSEISPQLFCNPKNYLVIWNSTDRPRTLSFGWILSWRSWLFFCTICFSHQIRCSVVLGAAVVPSPR